MSNSTKEDTNIYRSRYYDPSFKVPELPITDYLFDALDKNYEELKDEVWVGDVIKGISYKFSDIKPLTEKFASAITRLGLKKGEIIYFSAYDVALIYIIHIAVWRCGGAVRGCFQREDKEVHVSSGILLPLLQAKVLDATTGSILGPGKKGTIWMKTPYVMKGYAGCKKSKEFKVNIEEDGWLNTGDLGFFDDAGHLYVLERKSSIFKYYMHQVSPAEIETVIGEHPAVLSVGVVGVPDPLTTSAARAYVVLKPNHHATEEEIKQFVAERKIFYKHLHGGVKFVDSLPESRGGKLDRPALLQKAIRES